MKLTHRHVEVFRALMLSGSVTRAAELLHSSQPTVSRELARLEQVLQMNLFDRVRGRLRPTVRALALRDEVERSYVGLERIASTAASLRQFAAGRLEIACLPALAHALLPEAVRRFVAAHGQASVVITPLESPLLETRLTEQRHDLGLTERHEAPPGTTLLPLLQVDEVAVLPAGHALLARRVLRPTDFAGQPFVHLAADDPYRQQIDALFEAQRVQRAGALEAGSAVTVCALVRQGLGLAIVNPLTALELAGPDLHIRPLAMRVPFHVGLASPELRPPSPLREAFTGALRDAATAVKRRLKAAQAA
ncbi:LysR family transcriptional regulator [Aquabacterium humicola]|uniref:LysR family transcriptional regulator n=1 Tax=Aquabacterium humicola TaxID=3237377 RepID=UPI002543E8B6|nr:LysR family transcriptional regulator [Rubrivivax pictus]